MENNLLAASWKRVFAFGKESFHLVYRHVEKVGWQQKVPKQRDTFRMYRRCLVNLNTAA